MKQGGGRTNRRAEGWTDGRMDRCTDSPWVLQDFIPFRAAALLPLNLNHTLLKQGRATADHLLPLGCYFISFSSFGLILSFSDSKCDQLKIYAQYKKYVKDTNIVIAVGWKMANAYDLFPHGEKIRTRKKWFIWSGLEKNWLWWTKRNWWFILNYSSGLSSVPWADFEYDKLSCFNDVYPPIHIWIQNLM